MPPMKCFVHEQRSDELDDSPRYLRALAESRHCWRCRVIAVVSRIARMLGLEESSELGALLRPLIEGPYR